MVPLGEVLHPRNPDVEVRSDGEYHFAGVYCLGGGAFIGQKKTGLEFAYKRLTRLHAQDFTYPKLMAWEGAFAVVPAECNGLVVSTEFPVFTIDKSKAVPEFIGYYFKRASVWPDVAGNSTGTNVRRRRLHPSELLKHRIPLPSLNEQQRLVEYLDALSSKVDEVKRLRQEAAVEAEVLSAVFARIVERETADVALSSLFNHLTCHDSGWSPQCDDIPANDDQWAVLKTSSIQWDGFQPKENKALSVGMTPKPSLTVNEDDVLITRAGPVNRVGVACLVTQSHPHLMLSDKIVRLKTVPSLSPQFLTLYLRTPEAQEYFRQGKTGLADSQVNISREKLLRLPIRVPTLSIQRQLALLVQELQGVLISARHHQQESIIEIEAFFPSVLNQIFGA